MPKRTGFTQEGFERIKQGAEALGYVVLTRWRKGLKSIRLSPAVLGYRTEIQVGGTVRLKGKPRTAVVVGVFSDIKGGVRLSRPLGGCQSWNIADLEIANA